MKNVSTVYSDTIDAIEQLHEEIHFHGQGIKYISFRHYRVLLKSDS